MTLTYSNVLDRNVHPHGYMTEEQYRNLPGYRLSVIAAAEPGQHAITQVLNEIHGTFESTPAMQIGILAHLLALEPDKFAEDYTVFPSDTRFTAKLKAEQASMSKIPIKEKDIADAQKWAKAITNCPRWQSYGKFDAEVAYTMKFPGHLSPDQVITCKTRIDAVFNDRVCDLKFVRDIHPLVIRSEISRYKWDIKAAFQAMAAGKDKAELVMISKQDIPGIAYVEIPCQSVIDKLYTHLETICEIQFAIDNPDLSHQIIPMEYTWDGINNSLTDPLEKS